MEGFLAVSAATLILVGTVAVAGFSICPLIERRTGAATPLSVIVGLGAAALMIVIIACWVLNLDVAIASIVVVVLALAVTTVFTVVVARRSGIAGLRLRERHLGTMAIALAIAITALLPLTKYGFASWTAFINDFHRYALSAISWMANTGPGPEFLEQFTGAFGEEADFRGSFEKPGSTALLVVASAVTTISPAQVLTPLVALLLALTIAGLADLLRLAFRIPLVPAVAIATVGALGPASWGRVMDAQVGHVLSLALLATLLCIFTLLARRPADRISLAAVAIGLVLAGAVVANATVTASALPLVGAIGVALLIGAGCSARSVLVLAATSVIVAVVLIAPTAAGLAASIRSQTVGLDELPPLPLAHPIELLGVRAPEDTVVAALTWAALLVVIAIAGARAHRPTLALLPVAAVAASAVFLGVVYGPDGYELGKWLGLTLPIVATFGLGWLASRTISIPTRVAASDAATSRASRRDPTRFLPTGIVVVLAVGVIAASTSASGALFRVVGATEFAAAADPAIDALETVTVDTGDTYRDSILPARVAAERIAVAGATYASGGPPIGSTLFTTAARASERGWTVTEALTGGYVLARVPDASLPQRWDGLEVAPHLVGDWYPAEPTTVWSAGPGPVWLVFPLSEPLPAEGVTVRLGILAPATADSPKALTMYLGGRTLSFPPSAQSAREITVTIDARDVVEGRIVIGLDLDHDGPASVVVPSDLRSVEVGVTFVEVTTRPTSTPTLAGR